LDVDELTKKSRQILAQAAKQQEQWNQSGADSSDQQGRQIQNMPDRQMPQPSPAGTSQQDQMDQMHGMKMPREHSESSPTPNN
jgi:hypothetical protein